MCELAFENAIKILTSPAKFKINLGLEHVRAILALIDNPQDKLKYIHTAGTNGKGSTCAILNEILVTTNYNVGLYTSPHITDYTERIKINNINISKKDFAENVIKISILAEKNKIALTEFETLTVVAFDYFAKNNVDIVVLETGLGGRLDATNVIKNNICSIITSLSLEHTERLGNTIEKIAFEKACIIKKSNPAFISKNNVGFEIVKNYAGTQNSSLISPKINVDLDFIDNQNYAIFNNKKYKFNLLGLYQKENLELALAVVDYLKENNFNISKNDIKQALQSVKWTARFEYLKSINIIFDGAHNQGGAEVLRKSLDFYFPNKKRIWIYGSIATKDYSSIMQTLFRADDDIYFYKFDYPGAVEPEILEKATPFSAKEITKQEISALLHKQQNSLKVVAGSLYMISDILKIK